MDCIFTLTVCFYCLWTSLTQSVFIVYGLHWHGLFHCLWTIYIDPVCFYCLLTALTQVVFIVYGLHWPFCLYCIWTTLTQSVFIVCGLYWHNQFLLSMDKIFTLMVSFVLFLVLLARVLMCQTAPCCKDENKVMPCYMYLPCHSVL